MAFQVRKRDENERPIIAALTAIGARVCKIMGYAGGDFGVPDLLVAYRGRTILIEVKNPAGGKPKSKRSKAAKRAKGNDGPPENATGQLTPTQVTWWSEWTGGEAYVVETPEQAVALVRGEELPNHIKLRIGACSGTNYEKSVVFDLGISEAYCSPGEAYAVAGAVHELAGMARAMEIERKTENNNG